MKRAPACSGARPARVLAHHRSHGADLAQDQRAQRDFAHARTVLDIVPTHAQSHGLPR